MENNLNLMDAYFKGELSSQEQIEFDKRLKSDPDFQSEFQEMKLIKEAIKAEARKDTLQFLKATETSIKTKEITKTHTTMKKYISVAAGLLLVVSLTYLSLFNGTGEIDGAKVFDQYYQTYPNIAMGAERGTSIDLTNLRPQAYYAYDMGNFSQAESTFEKLVESEKTASNYFYLGLSNIETGNLESAKNNLNTVINNYDEYKEQAQWFLALTLMKSGVSEEALSNFMDLGLNGNSYKEESLRILKEVYGLKVFDSTSVILKQQEIEPQEEEDFINSPDGSTVGKRKHQFGVVVDPSNGDEFFFFNDRPIEGLRVGDVVEAVIIKRTKRGQGKGFAFLLG